jgi:hypothetical protein
MKKCEQYKAAYKRKKAKIAASYDFRNGEEDIHIQIQAFVCVVISSCTDGVARDSNDEFCLMAF